MSPFHTLPAGLLSLRWRACACQGSWYDRVERTWWMRTFFDERRLFRCMSCRRLFLIPPQTARGWRNEHDTRGRRA